MTLIAPRRMGKSGLIKNIFYGLQGGDEFKCAYIAPSLAESSQTGVFDYLESRKFRTVVAFDEFQQIAEYPEKGTEVLLRSRIRFLRGNRFIFSGSRQHMMPDISFTIDCLHSG